MRSLRFVIADVFTDKRFAGNQLAVFTDASGVAPDVMQDIAREMNYSETTFLLDPESGGDYRLRIFTPARELPFAGHPCVGTGHTIVAEGMKRPTGPATHVRLETGVGVIHIQVETGDGVAGRTTMSQPLPVVRTEFHDKARLARALGLGESEVGQGGLPAQAIHNGVTVLIVPVARLSSVQRIKIDVNEMERISEEAGAETVLAFTRETVEAANTVHCRVFAPAAGVIEDAATGSAQGPLGYYIVRHKLAAVDSTTRIISEQGYEMMRPSILRIEVDTDAGSGEVTGVRVGGGVVIAGRGEIYI